MGNLSERGVIRNLTELCCIILDAFIFALVASNKSDHNVLGLNMLGVFYFS